MTERKLSTPIVIVVSLFMILSLTLCPTPAVAPPIKYTITVTQGANGHITPGTTNVNQGDNQTFTITPSNGYNIASLIIDGSPVAVASSYTFSNVQAPHTITATFAIDTYTITVNQGANGQITPGTTTVNQGASQTFTITPNNGYSIASLIIDGSPVTIASSYTFNNVQAPHTIAATFSTDTNRFTITVMQGANGQITPGTTTVNYGASQTFTITANNGYYIASLIVDGSQVPVASSYTFSYVQVPHTITATFAIGTLVAQFTESATTVNTGVYVQFDASASHDPNGTITGYYWNFGDGSNATGIMTSHSYAKNGTYTVALTVTNNDGQIDSQWESILVHDRPPIASFITSSETVYTNDVVIFNATASHDPDGTIVSYFWDFGDGNYGAGSVVSHSFAENGTYTVTLNVTDNDGASDSAIATETILNHTGTDLVPIAVFTVSSQTVYTGEIITFDASASYDPDGTITKYQWNFGDNFTATGKTATHEYAESGLYLAMLTVTDSEGMMNATAAYESIQNRAPIANFTISPATVYTYEMITFNATASYDPDGAVVAYFWDFADGTNVTGPIVTHAYAQNGTCTVKLTVTDNDGASNATSVQVTIIDVLLVASFTTLPLQPKPGDTITFNAESSYDPNATIVNYRWDFGDGNITETGKAIVTHTYLGNGDFNVTLTVFDDKNRNDSTSSILSLQVHNVAVINVTLSATEVQIGQTLNITVKVVNNGTAPESFRVTVFGNETIIANQTVTLLQAGTDQVLVFYWNTSNVANAAKYLIQANASNVTGENELADNTYNGGVVSIVQPQNNGSSMGPSFNWVWTMPVFLGFGVPVAFVAWRRMKKGKPPRGFDYFDEITGGGIPDSFSVLVIGGPGSGKSILCQELVPAFLAIGKTCLYVTYDCFPGEIRDNLKKFNQDVSAYEAKKSLMFLDCYSSVAKTESKEEYALGQPFSLGDLGITLSETIGEMRVPTRVIFDSIVPLLTHVNPLKVIEFLQDRSARVKGVTGTLVFSAGKETIESSLANRLEEIVDCIIELDVSEKKGKTVRNLRIKKMSGKKTSDKWIEFEIDPARGIVFRI